MSAPSFYVKCRPQECDAANIALESRRVFIGYPAWIKGRVWNRNNVRGSLADLSVPYRIWKSIELNVPPSFRPRATMNRGFAKKSPGSTVVIPRPGEGSCHIGRVSTGFYVSNIRTHIGDVVQSWAVDEFRVVAFPMIPGWMKYRLLSRTTIGWLSDRPHKTANATEVLGQLYEGNYEPDFSPADSI